MELNSREVATLFWVAVILSCILIKGINKDISTSLEAVLKSFLHKKIQIIIWGGMIWASLCVFLLEEAGIWTVSNLKTTVIWCCTFAFLSTINAYKIAETKNHFKNEFRGIINTTVIVTFITEAYSFSILTEIAITPIVTLLVIIQALSERDAELAKVQKLSNFLLTIAGLAYVANAIYMLSQDLFGFVSLENLREFLTPTLLTCLYLLYIYTISIFMTYESLSAGLANIIKDPPLRKYAIFKSALAFNINLKALHLWKVHVGIFSPVNKEEITTSIKEIKLQIHREKNPVPIAPEQGWQPMSAASFLSDKKLIVEHYHRTYENEWWGDAYILKIDSGHLNRDSINYTIRGNDTAVKRLKLEVTIHNKDFHLIPENLFIDIGHELIGCSTGSSEVNLRQAINVNSDIDIVIGLRRVRLLRENYKHTKTGGYFRTLIVDHCPLYRASEDAR